MFFFRNIIINVNLFRDLISKKIQKQYIFVTFLMLVTMLLEIFTLNFVFLIVNLLTNKIDISSLTYLSNFFLYFKFETNFINIIILFFIIFLFKNLIVIYLLHKQSDLNAISRFELTNEFFFNYMCMPKIFHLRTNSSLLVKNIITETEYFCAAIVALTNILKEMIILVGIVVFLFFLNVRITGICLLLFIVFSFLYSKFNSKKISQMGRERSDLLEKRLKYITEGLAGKTVFDLSGRREKFFNDFREINLDFAKITKNSVFRLSLSKPLLEIFVFILIVFFLMISFKSSYNLSSLVPLLAVYITAAYRLLPSFTQILNNYQKLNSYVSAGNKLKLDKIKFDSILRDNNSKGEPHIFKNSLELKKIKFSYNNNLKNVVLNDINLKILIGKKIGIYGESGSGKSTLLDIIAGILQIESGDVLVDGKSIEKIKKNWQEQIGMVPQEVYVLDASIKKNIAFGMEENEVDDEKLMDSINRASLNSFINSLENKEYTIIGERGSRLSGGQKQRIGIARALYNNPKVLIFDESTNALDNLTEKKIINEIFNNNKDKTILFVSHNFENLNYCEEIYKLDRGILKRLK